MNNVKLQIHKKRREINEGMWGNPQMVPGQFNQGFGQSNNNGWGQQPNNSWGQQPPNNGWGQQPPNNGWGEQPNNGWGQQPPNNGWGEQNNGWGNNNNNNGWGPQQDIGNTGFAMALMGNQSLWGNNLSGMDWIQEQIKRQSFNIVSTEQGCIRMSDIKNILEEQITFLEPSPA